MTKAARIRRAAQLHLDFTGRNGNSLETWECHPTLDGQIGVRFGYLDFLVVDQLHGHGVTFSGAIGFDDTRVGIGATADGRKLVIVGDNPLPEVFLQVFANKPRKRRLKIGRINAIGYSANRFGKKEKYLHEFARSARPLLTVTRDGYWLVNGGAFRFTDRGIVDDT